MDTDSGPPADAATAALVWACSPANLHPALLERLRRVAADYWRQTGRALRIVSGHRTLRQQAELMSGMSAEQLEGMYCRGGYAGYVRELLRARAARGRVSARGTYGILRRRRDGYISAHLSGLAVDVDPDGADVPLLKQLLAGAGFRVLDERGLGVGCIHATWAAVPPRIVRE